jgi:hypothetical protein
MVQTSIDFSWTILDQDLQPARQPIECIFRCFFHKNKTISRRRYQNRGLGAGTSTPFFWHLIEQGGVSKLQTQRVRPLRQLELWDFMSFSLCLLRTGIVLHSRTKVETMQGECAGMVVRHCG